MNAISHMYHTCAFLSHYLDSLTPQNCFKNNVIHAFLVTVHGHFYLRSVISNFYLKIWWLPGVLILKPNLASICSPSWLSTIGRNQFIISVKIPQNDSVIEC